MVSTIVTTGMLKSICAKYKVKFFETLTGFKFIGEKIHAFEQDSSYTFLLGLEESYGYLAGTYARDKDAVVASMLIAEMAVFYHRQGKTLYDVMQELYQEFGYYLEETVSITLKGIDGAEKIQALMSQFRSGVPAALGGYTVCGLNDYKTGRGIRNGAAYDLDLPKSDVLQFLFENGSTFVVRPSGTEPKIKLYYLMREKDAVSVKAMLDAVQAQVGSMLD